MITSAIIQYANQHHGFGSGTVDVIVNAADLIQVNQEIIILALCEIQASCRTLARVKQFKIYTD